MRSRGVPSRRYAGRASSRRCSGRLPSARTIAPPGDRAPERGHRRGPPAGDHRYRAGRRRAVRRDPAGRESVSTRSSTASAKSSRVQGPGPARPSWATRGVSRRRVEAPVGVPSASPRACRAGAGSAWSGHRAGRLAHGVGQRCQVVVGGLRGGGVGRQPQHLPARGARSAARCAPRRGRRHAARRRWPAGRGLRSGRSTRRSASRSPDEGRRCENNDGPGSRAERYLSARPAPVRLAGACTAARGSSRLDP